ncbi:MAG: twin-arginine translocase TatA/TatE family subunit [Deltaproteobacteria bacterium]|nr:twin-arginine translocase TatA/TatE family subunit [Deltaproteobacteria bacterium]
MLGLSGEHLIILVGILLVFGPRRLPQAGATLGKAIRNFREQYKGIREPEFKRIPVRVEENHAD